MRHRFEVSRAVFLLVLMLGSRVSAVRASEDVSIQIDTPMPPPSWALLQRELLRAQSRACEEFFDRYFDDRGFLECVERWGGDDGPDDAIENLNDWPVLYSLGAPESVLQMIKK